MNTPAKFTHVNNKNHLSARTVALLGKGVRQLRSAQALTRGEFAERSGVSRTWLKHLESGTRRNAELRERPSQPLAEVTAHMVVSV